MITTSLFQGLDWAKEKRRDDDAIKKYLETFNRLEKIKYISRMKCVVKFLQLLIIIKKSSNKYFKKKKRKYESDGTGFRFPEGQDSFELWIVAMSWSVLFWLCCLLFNLSAYEK